MLLVLVVSLLYLVLLNPSQLILQIRLLYSSTKVQGLVRNLQSEKLVKVEFGNGVMQVPTLPLLLKEMVYSGLMDSLKRELPSTSMEKEFFGTSVMVKLALHMLGQVLVLSLLLVMPMLLIQMLQLDLEEFLLFLVVQRRQHSYLESKHILYLLQAKQGLLLHYPMLVLVTSPHFLEQQNPLLTTQKIRLLYSILLEDLPTGLQKITVLMLVLLPLNQYLDLLLNPLLEHHIQELVILQLLMRQKKELQLLKKVQVISLPSVVQQNVLPSVQMKRICSSLTMDVDMSFAQEHTSVRLKSLLLVLLLPTHHLEFTQVKVRSLLRVLLISNLFLQHLPEPTVGSYKIYK